MVIIEVKGVNKVIRGLSNFRGNVGRGVERGLVKAGNMLIRESLKIVPVQTGNLKASWDVRKTGSGLRTNVTVGYFGVAYAVYVHEIPGKNIMSPVTHGKEFNIKHAAEIEAAKGTPLGTAQGGMFYRKPEEQWKFLEQPVREKRQEILQIIRQEVRKIRK